MRRKTLEIKHMYEDQVREQGAIFAQIIADSKTPDLTGALLTRLVNNAVVSNDLARQLNEAIAEDAKIPKWLKGFAG